MTSVNYQYFPEIFGLIVSKASELIQSNSSLVQLAGVDLIYEYGTLVELQKRTEVKDKRGEDKYPLVWLVWERPSNKKKYLDGIINSSYSVSPSFFVVAKTSPDYSSVDRYENIFKPILIPIHEAIIDAIDYVNDVSFGRDFEIESYEDFFWGMGNDGRTVLSDYNDAIEDRLNDLIVNKIC